MKNKILEFFLIFFALILSTLSDDKSLVIVFDATASMGDDLVQLRSSAIEIINDLSSQEKNEIINFILIVFRDPGEEKISKKSSEFFFE